MNNRFTLKDFFFTLLLLVVITVVVLALAQFNYEGRQILRLSHRVQQIGQQQLREIQLLQQLPKNGVAAPRAGPAPDSAAAAGGPIRTTLANGWRYVCYPQPPLPPHNPYVYPDYSPGDWLVLNLASEPKKIAPFITQDEVGYEVQNWVLESLITRNPKTLQWQPWLARSYKISPDGLTIIFHLRRKACFSDGRPVLARDVVFSFHTVMNPQVDAAPLRGYLSDVKSCRATGRRTVTFRFRHPYFKALEEVGGITIIPERVYHFKNGADFNQHGARLVGSGPYVLGAWHRGQQLVLLRNPRYWGPYPTFNRIVFRFISNSQAALQEFLNGQIDEDAPTPDQWIHYTGEPGFSKKYICYKFLPPTAGYLYIGWNLREPMFHDRRTRTALTMLIDRAAIIKTFLHGLARPMTGPFNPLSPQNNPRIQPLPYAPHAAEQLLRRAGWKMGGDGILHRGGQPFKFHLMLRAGDVLLTRIAVYIKQQLARAGVAMNLEPYEWSVLLQRIDQRRFHAVLLGWTGGIEGDPYQIWDSASIKDRGSNFIGFNNRQADKLITRGRREMNTAQRMKIWHQLQAIIYRQQPYTFLFTSDQLDFIAPRFRNTRPYKLFGVSEGDWFVPAALQKYH